MGGEVVGRTKTVTQSLDPKWADASFVLPAFVGRPTSDVDDLSSRLELYVMDEDLASAPDFLGYLRLEHASLLETDKWRTVELGDDPEKKQATPPQEKNMTDMEHRRLQKQRDRGSLTFRVKALARVKLTLVSAYDLPENNKSLTDRLPDPYAVVKYLGGSVGQSTRVVSDTLRPVWYHTVELQVPVPSDGKFGDPAIIEIYDKNSLTSDVKIGVAVVSQERLLYPHDHPGVIAIVDRAPSQSTSLSSAQKEKKKKKRAQEEDDAPPSQRGWLQVFVETSRIGGLLEPRRRPDVSAVYARATDPRDGREYWYDKCSGEQFWEDPRSEVDAFTEKVADLAKKTPGAALLVPKVPPVEVIRLKKGFPIAPAEVSAVGQATAAKISWSASKENGPPVVGYSVERQRRVDGSPTAEWHAKGSVYVDAEAQARADAEAARQVGARVDKRKNKEKQPPPTAVVVDKLADDARYRFRVIAHNDVGTSAPSAWSNEVRVCRPLPENWVEKLPNDRTERPYYYNSKTRESTWRRPAEDPFFVPASVFARFARLEMEHLKSVFSDRDTDKSQAMSLREFEACLPDLGELLSKSDILWLFYQADLDPTAELDFANFARAVRRLSRFLLCLVMTIAGRYAEASAHGSRALVSPRRGPGARSGDVRGDASVHSRGER